jgi:hypothetical protein
MVRFDEQGSVGCRSQAILPFCRQAPSHDIDPFLPRDVYALNLESPNRTHCELEKYFEKSWRIRRHD